MKVGAIVPHLMQFGGVRRFLEIGNVFTDRGNEFTIFTRKGERCTWFDFRGTVKNWNKIQADYILIGDAPSFRILPRARGQIYIYVIAGGSRYLGMYSRMYGKYPFILNNRVFKKYFPKHYLVEGGVNIHRFTPKKLLPASSNTRVLFYDVKREGKETKHIAQSLRGISGIRLVGLHGLNDQALVKAYHTGDFFIAWESREGWCNMAAEAIACGLTVITNGTNCEPFRDKVITVGNLREFFLNPHNRKIRKRGSMEKFSWESVTDQLIRIFARPYIKHHAHRPHVHKSHTHHHHR